jgi:hypothetical protein
VRFFHPHFTSSPFPDKDKTDEQSEEDDTARGLPGTAEKAPSCLPKNERPTLALVQKGETGRSENTDEIEKSQNNLFFDGDGLLHHGNGHRGSGDTVGGEGVGRPGRGEAIGGES